MEISKYAVSERIIEYLFDSIEKEFQLDLRELFIQLADLKGDKFNEEAGFFYKGNMYELTQFPINDYLELDPSLIPMLDDMLEVRRVKKVECARVTAFLRVLLNRVHNVADMQAILPDICGNMFAKYKLDEPVMPQSQVDDFKNRHADILQIMRERLLIKLLLNE